jgi:hypothetical protein
MEIVSLTENHEATITLRCWVSSECHRHGIPYVFLYFSIFRIPCYILRISAKSSIIIDAEFWEIPRIAPKIPYFAGSQKIVSIDILLPLAFSSAENFVAAAVSTLHPVETISSNKNLVTTNLAPT